MPDNKTLELIVARLPAKPLLSPREIADACGLATSQPIIDAIHRGEIPSINIGGRYVVARECAIEFLTKKSC